MSVDKTNYGNENRYVVLLDIKKFHQYWIDQFSDMPEGSTSKEAEEYYRKKYTDAEGGFAKGIENPVPAPVVSAFLEKTLIRKPFKKKIQSTRLNVRFENGLTRTQWLLKNNFDVCPILTDCDSAYLLHKYFRLHGTGISTVGEMIAENSLS